VTCVSATINYYLSLETFENIILAVADTKMVRLLIAEEKFMSVKMLQSIRNTFTYFTVGIGRKHAACGHIYFLKRSLEKVTTGTAKKTQRPSTCRSSGCDPLGYNTI
jgi:hypothetical protein